MIESSTPAAQGTVARVKAVAAIIDPRAFDSSARWREGEPREKRRRTALARARDIIAMLAEAQKEPFVFDGDFSKVETGLYEDGAMWIAPKTASGVREALRWVDRNIAAAKEAMAVSAKQGNGYANFAAHDAYKHLTTIRESLPSGASTRSEGPWVAYTQAGAFVAHIVSRETFQRMHAAGFDLRHVAAPPALATAGAAPATEVSQPEPSDALPGGWIVANGAHTLFRCWTDGLPGWTPDRNKATRYVRRSDAEAAHQEDIDAWGILPFHEPAEGQTFSIEHDAFTGTVQGYYVTREGKQGVVLQQVGTKVVHVYGRKWLKPNG